MIHFGRLVRLSIGMVTSTAAARSADGLQAMANDMATALTQSMTKKGIPIAIGVCVSNRALRCEAWLNPDVGDRPETRREVERLIGSTLGYVATASGYLIGPPWVIVAVDRGPLPVGVDVIAGIEGGADSGERA